MRVEEGDSTTDNSNLYAHKEETGINIHLADIGDAYPKGQASGIH